MRFQQCGIWTSVDSDQPAQPPFKLRNSKWCSISSLTVIVYSSDKQRLWSDCAYAQADLRLCWSHIPHCWKSHVATQIKIIACVLRRFKCFVRSFIVRLYLRIEGQLYWLNEQNVTVYFRQIKIKSSILSSMFTVVALGPVTYLTNGTGSQLTTVNTEGIIPSVNFPLFEFILEANISM